MQKQLLLLFVLLGCILNANAFTVVLDAGHGGHDAGAVGAFSKEKNINLKYVLEVGDLIKKNHPDVKVIYTRNKDVFVNLNERARIANRAKADLFISIHTNASKNKDANGMETFTLGASRSKENMEVAMLENSVILLEDNYEKKYEGFDPNSTDSYIMFEFMKDQYMDRSIRQFVIFAQPMAVAGQMCSPLPPVLLYPLPILTVVTPVRPVVLPAPRQILQSCINSMLFPEKSARKSQIMKAYRRRSKIFVKLSAFRYGQKPLPAH